MKVKLAVIDKSVGILLSDEALRKLYVDPGDTLCLVDGPDGCTLKAYDPEFGEQVEAAQNIENGTKMPLKNWRNE